MVPMSTTDSTFLWETEALRDSSRRRGLATSEPTSATPDPVSPTGDWVTLREAHDATGIPVETLRKWARRGSIPSHLDEGVRGTRRMIQLGDVETRAAELGREIAPVAGTTMTPRSEVGIAPTTTDEPGPLVDLTETNNPESTVTVTVDQAPDEATMIVPIAAWDKMLMQLGNLHEAGQQLAEARERAAKAETENRFLRERLADMRQEKEATETKAAPAPREAAEELDEKVAVEPSAPAMGPETADDEPARPASDATGPTRRLVRSLRRWRIEVRRR